MTQVPASALRSADMCPMNLAPAASRLPMAFPTRVDAAIPGGAESKNGMSGRVRACLRVLLTDAKRDGIQN